MSDSLSHSCPTCGGTGGLELPCGQPHILPHEDITCTQRRFQQCPDCIDGYPKDRIERAAEVLHGEHPGYECSWVPWDELMPSLQDGYRAKALAAIRAFHTEPTDHD